LGERKILSKILAAVDGSSYAWKALDYAIDLAGKYKSTLTIAYVAPRILVVMRLQKLVEHALEEQGQRILDEAKERAHAARVEAEVVLLWGNPAEEILKRSKTEDYDLIVVGGQGLSAVEAFLLGSVSDNVTHHAECPVLVVR
jgi:nucleotide-binding universal stress UspA family protein